MIKILHVTSDRNIGGAGKLILNLLKCSNRQDFDISVVLPRESMLAPKIRELGFEAITMDINLKSLLKVIKEKAPDIVHTHASATARVAAKLCGAKTLNTRHCATDNEILPFSFKRLIYRCFNAIFTDFTIATADYVKEVLISEGISKNKIKVIINGSVPLKTLSEENRLKIRERFGYSSNDFIVGIIARLEYGKGHEYFIKAAEICQRQAPQIKFIIAGDGSMYNELKCSAAKMQNLRFLGFLEDVTEIINILDVNVNCSYVSETSSLSLSEGMSVGTPILVSDCGGNVFMAENCGLIFRRKNSDDLAAKLLHLFNCPEKLKQLSKNAQKRFFAEFTAKRMTEQTENLYVNMLKNRI